MEELKIKWIEHKQTKNANDKTLLKQLLIDILNNRLGLVNVITNNSIKIMDEAENVIEKVNEELFTQNTQRLKQKEK